MALVQARPRDWEAGFDTVHLAVPALAALVALLIAFLPARPMTRTRVVPPAPPQIVPTTILGPTAGATLTAGQPALVEGLAHPGSIVRLYWYSQPIGEPTRVGRDGRWQFSIGGLPAGTHSIRAGALVSGRHVWSGETVFTAVTVAPKAPAKPAAKTPVKSGSSGKPSSKTSRPRP